MKRKFKTRIAHYLDDFYVVEYTNHYFIPKYKPIKEPFFGTNKTWLDEYLMRIKEAKAMIVILKSINDVTIIEQKIYDNAYCRRMKMKSLSYKL